MLIIYKNNHKKTIFVGQMYIYLEVTFRSAALFLCIHNIFMQHEIAQGQKQLAFFSSDMQND